MAALKETPRQKMMGILYLVLLGIAATTVTDHVLDAFRNLTISLETSTKNVQNTVSNTFAAFEATKLKNEPERAKPVYDRAIQVKKYCTDLDNYINEVKTLLVEKGGGIEESNGDVKARADVDISPRIMVRHKKAADLKKLIEDTRNKIIAIAWPSPAEQQGLHLALNAQDPPKRKGSLQSTWEEDNFGEGIPLTAAITALTKIQADLKNTESDAVKKILGEADKAVINLDRFQAVAVAPSSYILIGQQYKADVFLTAFDSKTNPDITVGGQKLNIVDGKGLYVAAATSEGEKKWSGTIRIKQTDGTEKEYQLPEQTYYVAKPSATVSPTKMNVFYIGVPNPVSVSAPGISMDKVHVGISEGEIKGSNGQYIVNVKTRGTVKITVTGDFGGHNAVLGVTDFRVKPIPPPHAKFGGKGGGRLTAAAMKAQNRMFAVLDDFEFDAPFTIQHFTLYITKPRGDVQVFESTTNGLTPAMMSGMNSIVPGSKVYFDLISGTGVDGMKRQLDPIIFTVE